METYSVSTSCPECGAQSEGIVKHLPVNGGAVHKAEIRCREGHRASGKLALGILERCPGCNGRLLRP